MDLLPEFCPLPRAVRCDNLLGVHPDQTSSLIRTTAGSPTARDKMEWPDGFGTDFGPRAMGTNPDEQAGANSLFRLDGLGEFVEEILGQFLCRRFDQT